MCYTIKNKTVFTTEAQFLQVRKYFTDLNKGVDPTSAATAAMVEALDNVMRKHECGQSAATKMLEGYVVDEHQSRMGNRFAPDMIAGERLPMTCSTVDGRPARFVA